MLSEYFHSAPVFLVTIDVIPGSEDYDPSLVVQIG